MKKINAETSLIQPIINIHPQMTYLEKFNPTNGPIKILYSIIINI